MPVTRFVPGRHDLQQCGYPAQPGVVEVGVVDARLGTHGVSGEVEVDANMAPGAAAPFQLTRMRSTSRPQLKSRSSSYRSPGRCSAANSRRACAATIRMGTMAGNLSNQICTVHYALHVTYLYRCLQCAAHVAFTVFQ